MSSISLTFGDTVRSFPALVNTRNKRLQKEVRKVLEKTKVEILQRLKTPGRDYNDHTYQLRYGFRSRRMSGFKYRVYNNTPYASFIENGTRYIKERKMLHREIANGRARLRRRLRKLEQMALRGAYL